MQVSLINEKKINEKLKKVLSMYKTLVETEESAGAVIQRFSIRLLEKSHKIYQKIAVLESLFNELSGLVNCNFIKK